MKSRRKVFEGIKMKAKNWPFAKCIKEMIKIKWLFEE